MKAISQAISQFSSEDISTIEQEKVTLKHRFRNSTDLSDVIITTEDVPGWVVYVYESVILLP